MAPPNLSGLNLIRPVQQNFDSQDLLAGTQFPDLSAQLELWTNLPFESEDGPAVRKPHIGQAEDDDDDDLNNRNVRLGKDAAIHDGHVNVVTGTNVGSNLQPGIPADSAASLSFDVNSFLAGFGIDQFAVAQQLQQSDHSPSLAQLLALHSGEKSFSTLANDQRSTSQQSPGNTTSEPASKRARTRKSSVSTAASSSATASPSISTANTTTPLSAAEDKRRRNTAASARFRLKKKEREAALEGKAKELETRVNELERECEGLRRENGWLKGLVVGVTGAAQGSNPVPSVLPSTSTTTGVKRPRDDDY